MADNEALQAPSILLLAEYGATGGTRTYFKQLLALYAEKCARVTVLRTFEDEEIDNLCHLYGFGCVSLSSIVGETDIFRGKFPSRLLLEKHLFKKFMKIVDADIVVASVGTPELFLGAISWVKQPIYILHTYPMSTKNLLKRTLRKFFLSSFIPTEAKIITVSKFAKRCIHYAWGLWGHSKPVSVVYNTAGDLIINKASPSSGIVNVLTVGHVEIYKNPETWINMAIYLRKNMPGLNIKFTWVGDGSKLDECRAKVRVLCAESFISFVGRDNDVTKYYELCDIYVQPSYIESLGLSVLDAMRYGKPCVVANTGGLPEVVRDGESGWVVDADDVKQMACKIEVLVKDIRLREEMGRRALWIYEERFSKKQWTDEIWRHHAKVLLSA